MAGIGNLGDPVGFAIGAGAFPAFVGGMEARQRRELFPGAVEAQQLGLQQARLELEQMAQLFPGQVRLQGLQESLARSEAKKADALTSWLTTGHEVQGQVEGQAAISRETARAEARQALAQLQAQGGLPVGDRMLPLDLAMRDLFEDRFVALKESGLDAAAAYAAVQQELAASLLGEAAAGAAPAADEFVGSLPPPRPTTRENVLRNLGGLPGGGALFGMLPEVTRQRIQHNLGLGPRADEDQQRAVAALLNTEAARALLAAPPSPGFMSDQVSYGGLPGTFGEPSFRLQSAYPSELLGSPLP